MENIGKKSILLISSFLKHFSGSEIAILDLSKEFLKLNYSVTVGTLEWDYPLKNEFSNLDIQIIDLNISNCLHFDIIWAQHFMTLELCLLFKNITSDKIIYSSLSPFTPMEAPPICREKIDLFLANSWETKEELYRLGIDREAIYLLPNPVSDNFFIDNKKKEEKSIRKIAIVSNHLVDEVKNAIQIMNFKNIETEIFGFEGNQVLLTPEILLEYDVVISIGRTVQYCLAMGIPIFCYDKFGGPGWINKENIENSSKYNFSGRCCNTKLLPEEIVRDILNGFRQNLEETPTLKKISIKKYKLGLHVDKILSILYDEKNELNTEIKNYREVSIKQKKYYFNKEQKELNNQLFFDKGDGFSESSSIKQDINNNFFELPSNNNIKSLRFDPLNDYCIIKFNYFKINGEMYLGKEHIKHNGIEKNSVIYFPTNDSQIYLNTNATDMVIKNVELNLEYIAVLEDAKSKILDVLKKEEENEELKNKIESLNNEAIKKEEENEELKIKIDVLKKMMNELKLDIKIIELQSKNHG